MSSPKIPSELKDLAKFLEPYGFTLAIPFDNIRKVGYIGTFDDKGVEHIVDDGSCFEKHRSVKPRRPARIVLGDFTKHVRFSLRSFLKFFGSIVGIDVGLSGARSVSIRFPKRFLQSNYITEIELVDLLGKLTPICRRKVTDPKNFVITQTAETDAIGYIVELRRAADAQAQADLSKAIEQKAKSLEIEAKVSWESDRKLSLVVSDPETRLTVAYKPMRIAAVPVGP